MVGGVGGLGGTSFGRSVLDAHSAFGVRHLVAFHLFPLVEGDGGFSALGAFVDACNAGLGCLSEARQMMIPLVCGYGSGGGVKRLW